MNKMTYIIFTIFLLLVCINMAWGVSNTMLETPKYKLIKKTGAYEIRDYEPMTIARTVVNSDYRDATNAGFSRIAGYIFGGNDENMEIAMTAPVISNSPGDVEDEYEILFVMPSSFERSSLPKPNSSTVEIMDRSLNLIACISFGGWATKERAKKYHLKLSNWLKEEGYEVDGKFMVAQYNSPYVLPPFRHNEIMVRIKK